MAGPVRFEWDEAKNRENQAKHGVSFEEAMTVFVDENALLIDDPEHSDAGEERFVLLGLSAGFRVLLVCHCYRHEDMVIRLISARKANRAEQRDYLERLRR